MSEDAFYRSGLRFQCTRCSRCCRHTPGYVFLSRKDLEALLPALGVGRREFLNKYCRRVVFGPVKRISLKEKPNLDCIFWENNESAPEARRGGCSVYDSRPLQCQSFPFWSSCLSSREEWMECAAQCPGIGRGHLHRKLEVDRWLARRREDGFIEG